MTRIDGTRKGNLKGTLKRIVKKPLQRDPIIVPVTYRTLYGLAL